MEWIAKDISDDAYFAIGDIFGGMDEPKDRHSELVVSNSFIKKVYETNLYYYLEDGHEEVDEELQEIFDVGSGFHCHVLEADKFSERYRVSDTLDASDDRVRISLSDYTFIEQTTMSIKKKYPYMMNNENAEITIMGEIDGVPVKCKIDKLHITANKSGRYLRVEILDLKGIWFDPFKQKKSSNKDRWELRKKLSSNDYDLQAYFYTRLVTEWLISIGQGQAEVVFSLLVSSKETFKAQKFRVGQEMMLSGEEKFNSVWSDIREFSLYGKDRLIDEEVL